MLTWIDPNEAGWGRKKKKLLNCYRRLPRFSFFDQLKGENLTEKNTFYA